MFGQTAFPLCTALAMIAAPAVAQAATAPAGPITLAGDVKVDRVITENGQSRHVLLAPDKVVPGERLVFTTSYRNSGTKPIQNFVVTNPVPPAVVVADGGDSSALVSIDGGAHWGTLSSLTLSDGKGGKRPAQASDITHLRWTVPLIAPGQTGNLEYHATVR